MYFIQISLLSLFALAILVQFYYYLFRFGRVLRKKPAFPAPEEGTAEAVSVIISAHNELENLQRLLPELMEQQYPDFEVIVVNDRSSDGSEDYLTVFKKAHAKLKVISLEQIPAHITAKKYALTMGIKNAKNDLLVFTDADCLPASPQWLAAMAGPFRQEQKKIVLGFSQYEKEKGLLNTFIRYETLHTGLMYLGSALAGHPYMGVGRNLAYRKSFFLEKKGFIKHRTISGGDDDLFVNQNGNKSNTAVMYGPEALVYSIPKKKWGEWYRQKLRHLQIGKWYKKRNKTFLGLYLAAQLLFWITFIVLLSLWIEPYIVISGFLIRNILLYYSILAGSRKLGDKFAEWHVFLLDFLFLFYHFFIGLAAFFTKRTKWK